MNGLLFENNLLYLRLKGSFRGILLCLQLRGSHAQDTSSNLALPFGRSPTLSSGQEFDFNACSHSTISLLILS
jgi:hypothetical protein